LQRKNSGIQAPSPPEAGPGLSPHLLASLHAAYQFFAVART
jgi:hypothetical protein